MCERDVQAARTLGRSTPEPVTGGVLTPDHIVARKVETLSAEIDGEVVALDIAKGVCYGLDGVGARIWALIETPTRIDAVCASLMADYDVDARTCRADVLDLLADLASEGLITVRSSLSSPPITSLET